jgi:hypothetical protein
MKREIIKDYLIWFAGGKPYDWQLEDIENSLNEYFDEKEEPEEIDEAKKLEYERKRLKSNNRPRNGGIGDIYQR